MRTAPPKQSDRTHCGCPVTLRRLPIQRGHSGSGAREPDRRSGGRTMVFPAFDFGGVDGDNSHTVPAEGDVRHGPAAAGNNY